MRRIEMISLFADYHGNSIFSIFFREVRVLLRIEEMLEHGEYPMEYDDCDNAIENSDLRRIYHVLSRHKMNEKQKPGNDK